MGFFEQFARPKKVQDAVLNAENTAEALSAMGRRGSQHATELKDIRKEKVATDQLEAALERAKTYAISAEGDVLPPDPSVIQNFEDKLKRN